MKISYNWLKDFLKTNEPAETIAQKLTMAGIEVGACEKVGDDWVLEIEITSNRPDWLSHIGIARELAAITGKKMSQVTSHKSQVKNVKHAAGDLGQVSIKLEDKIGCPLYTARIIEGLSVRPGKDFISTRLNALGIRCVNNVVDISNYCLLESGQPVHAFDLDKIIKRQSTETRAQKPEIEIIVRRAKAGEKIVTIDGLERLLSPGNLVIADKSGPIAIAGVMGGRDTEVDVFTKRVFLESAYFDPVTIRRSRQKLGLNTESSYRFERGVHIPTVYCAQERIKELLALDDQAAVYSKIYAVKSQLPKKKAAFIVDVNDINKLLGINLNPARIKKILTSLGFKVKAAPKNKLKLDVPDFRQDIKISQDIAEEVARIYGYDKIPLSLPEINIAKAKTLNLAEEVARIIKDTLIGCGFFEVISYSLMSQAKAQEALGDTQEIIAIDNPLSKEQEVLRPSLLPGLLDIASYNFDHYEEDVKIFHLGSLFKPLKTGIEERMSLGVLAFGKKMDDWSREACLKSNIRFNFFDLKGVVENILTCLGIDSECVNFKRLNLSIYASGNCAGIEIKEKIVGSIGRVSPAVLKKWGIRKQDIFVSLIDLKEILQVANLVNCFKAFSPFPVSKRDISLIAKDDVLVQDIKDAILEANIPILEKVFLFDEYKDERLPKGSRSLSFSLQFGSQEQTLKDEELNKAMQEIKDLLSGRFSVTFR